MTDAGESPKQASKIKESARQIWLAGLGAYNKAEEDAGKVFDKLVQEGEELERKTRGVFEKQIRNVEDRVEDVKGRANNTLDKLEQVFDQRVLKALNRLRMPTYSQFLELKEELEAMRQRVEELEGKQKAGKGKGSSESK